MHNNSPRWDYIVGYNEQAYFIEVHPASTSEVDNMIKKLDWLKKWLMENASAVYNMKGPNPFFWIASGKVSAILPTSKYGRRLAKAGLNKPMSVLKLQ